MASKQQREVESFNARVPVGGEVDYRADSGAIERDKTRSAACLLSGHTPVIWLEKRPACVLLSRCVPVQPTRKGGAK